MLLVEKGNIKIKKKQFSFGEMLAIELGEKGRNRYIWSVPVEATPEQVQNGQIDVEKTNNENWKIVPDVKEIPRGYLYYFDTFSGYEKGSIGTIAVMEQDLQRISVIGVGKKAAGKAGLAAQNYDFLLSIPFGTFIKVIQTGKFQKPIYKHFGINGVTDLGYDNLSLFCKNMGEEIPKDFIDLLSVLSFSDKRGLYLKKNTQSIADFV